MKSVNILPYVTKMNVYQDNILVHTAIESTRDDLIPHGLAQ